MDKVIPVFKSHYSLGRSILTLEKEKGPKDADSILLLTQELGRKHFTLVDDSISGFLECHTNCKDMSLDFNFGLRLSIVPDLDKKDDESLTQSSKYIVFANNTDGYKRLIKISTKAATDGFYYEPRIDFKTLKSWWNNDSLTLGVPFYDSFVFNNTMLGRKCIPEFHVIDTKPIFFLEDNELPFDSLIRSKVQKYVSSEGFETQETQSIYYKKRADFKHYLTARCINNRSTLEKPDLDHMSSDSFCVDNWLERNKS